MATRIALILVALLAGCASPTRSLYLEHVRSTGNPKECSGADACSRLTPNYRDGLPLCEIFTVRSFEDRTVFGAMFRKCLNP